MGENISRGQRARWWSFMMNFIEFPIFLIGIIIGGFSLVFFGYMCLTYFLPMLVWAMELKEIRVTRARELKEIETGENEDG